MTWSGRAARSSAEIRANGSVNAVPAVSSARSPRCRASSATVRCSKTSCTAIWKPASRIVDTRTMARMESPPRSKKLSWTPTRSTPSAVAQASAMRASVSVRGAAYRSSADRSGAGSAARSSFPAVFRGQASRATYTPGTM